MSTTIAAREYKLYSSSCFATCIAEVSEMSFLHSRRQTLAPFPVSDLEQSTFYWHQLMQNMSHNAVPYPPTTSLYCSLKQVECCSGKKVDRQLASRLGVAYFTNGRYRGQASKRNLVFLCAWRIFISIPRIVADNLGGESTSSTGDRHGFLFCGDRLTRLSQSKGDYGISPCQAFLTGGPCTSS